MYKKEITEFLEKIKTLKKKLVDFFSIKSLKGIINIGTDYVDFKNCRLTIEYGKLNEVRFFDVAPLVSIKYIPSDKENFELIKLPTNRTGLPIGINYKLRYSGEYNNDTIAYLKLNFLQVFKIGLVQKKYLFQTKEFKIGILKYMTITLIGFLLFKIIPVMVSLYTHLIETTK